MFCIVKPVFAIGNVGVASNAFGEITVSSVSTKEIVFNSYQYQNEMSISISGDRISFRFADGSYRQVNIKTNEVIDVSKLLHSRGTVEDGEVDNGTRISNYYLVIDSDKPIWYLTQENQGVYDDYLLFADVIKSGNTENIVYNLKDENIPLLQSTIDSYTTNSEEVSSCALEKSLLDYGYNGHDTWDECSGGTRMAFIVSSAAVLTCFIPGNVYGCGILVLAWGHTAQDMMSTGDHCSASYERAEANYNRCYSSNYENDADDPTRDTGGDTYNSGGLRCDRWVRVRNYWSHGQGGPDSGGWASREVCTSWVRY